MSKMNILIKDIFKIVTGFFLATVVFLTTLLLMSYFASSALASAEPRFSFDRDLTIGSTGVDVRALQLVLNHDPQTRLATSGPGSPGQETEYFGTITRNAVIRFQEKYASEILTPLGLTGGTGYFGPSTREKVNSLLSYQQKPEPEKPKGTEPGDTEAGTWRPQEAPSMYTDELMLNQLSDYYGGRGSTLTLYGFGFTSSNNIYFGDDFALRNVRAESYDTIKISIPEELAPGYYDLQIENEKGRDTESQAFFVVTDENSVSPRVDSVSPEHVGPGDTVTVYGEGFDGRWNMIRTTFFIAEGRSSDGGKTLTFKVPDPVFKESEPDEAEMDIGLGELPATPMADQNLDTDWSSEVYLYVVNNGGISTDYGKFILEF